jgi:hypothetical protein
MLVAVVNLEMLPRTGEPEEVTVPEPEAVWQAPSAPRYCAPEQVPKRFTISFAAAGAMFVAVVNFGMLPPDGEPVDVSVPVPPA